MWAEYAEAVRVVDHQRGLRIRAQRSQFAQRRDVAIHAEDAVGCQQRGGIGASIQLLPGSCDIGMRIAFQLGAAELRSVEQAGVVELVLHAHIAWAKQRLQHAEVRHVAGGEQQRTFAPGPLGQCLFQLGMLGAMTADQVCRRAADTFFPRATDQRVDQLRVPGQAEVVVAAERQQTPATDLQPWAIRMLDRAQPAQQLGALAFGRAGGKALQQIRSAHGALIYASPAKNMLRR